MKSATRLFDRYKDMWRELGFYERFEQLAAIFLSILVSVVVFFACLRVAVEVYELIIFKDDLMDPAVFANIFAMVLTVLIALEFNHSIVQVIERKQSLVQVRIVVQIAILAIVRKFILLDATKTAPMILFGLAAIVVSLAALYFVVREHRPAVARSARKDT